MSPGEITRYWHTLRHLRPVQVYGRAWLRVTRPQPDLRIAPTPRTSAAAWRGCRRPATLRGPRTFGFLGVERTLHCATDWNRSDWPRLWIYNAHYFDDLVATDAYARASWHPALIADWIAGNPPGEGAGWEPYPSSLRIVNWIKWALAGGTLNEVATHNLAVQVRYLRKRLEYHLLGNHLWANAKALIFAGVYFDGEEASAWCAKGLALLRRELDEQILPDGGHFERSPMYHAIVLEDMLDLIHLAAVLPVAFDEADVDVWKDTAARMLHWMHVMSHPDGGIAFFNDTALSSAPDVAALADYAGRIGVSAGAVPLAAIEALSYSGYVRLQAGPAVLIADVAPIGPDYLPGHAHADTLSFELSLQDRRVLVNGGTSTYENNEERLRQRGTAMHNTVMVDEVDSSEVWSSFRVARRARPFDVRWGRQEDAVWVEASHDGYRRLPGDVIHRRRWQLGPAQLEVTDNLTGLYRSAVAHFHCAPGLDPVATGEGAFGMTMNDLQLTWHVEGASRTTVRPGTWHPRFGATESSQVLAIQFAGNTLVTGLSWT